MPGNENCSHVFAEEIITAFEHFFTTTEFKSFLLRLGKEDDRFDSLNSVVRESGRSRKILEKEEYLFAFVRQRELVLISLKYLLWDAGELDQSECATVAPETVIDLSVDSGFLEPELGERLLAVFDHDLFYFDPKNRPFRALERLEADERLEHATLRVQRHIEEVIENVFDELKGI